VLCWLERGPYAWAIELNLLIADSYSTKMVWLFTLMAWLLPLLWLGKVLHGGNAFAAILRNGWGFIICVLLVVAHLSATIWLMRNEKQEPILGNLTQVAEEVSFLPREAGVTGIGPLLDSGNTIIVKSNQSGGFVDKYVPLRKDSWPSDDLPVLVVAKLRGVTAGLPDDVYGSIVKRPLPYEVRRTGVCGDSLWGLVIEWDGKPDSFLIYQLLIDFFAILLLGKWYADRRKISKLERGALGHLVTGAA